MRLSLKSWHLKCFAVFMTTAVFGVFANEYCKNFRLILLLYPSVFLIQQLENCERIFMEFDIGKFY